MSIKLKPLGDRLIVEPIEREEVTASGIVLPEIAREKPQVGKVLTIGPGQRDEGGERILMDIKEGDRVLFARYAGTEVKLEADRKVLVLRESDILAIVE